MGITFFRMLVFSLCFAVLAAASASAEEVLKIKPRSGVFLKMLVDAPAAAKAAQSHAEVIMITAHGSEELVLETIKKGAYDYIKKPS